MSDNLLVPQMPLLLVEPRSHGPSIIQAIWDNTTKEAWILSGEINRLHNNKRFKYPVGTIVLCINKDTRTIFGIATITSECAERSLLDPSVYTGDDEKYNKFECTIAFRMFASPIDCETVRIMCGSTKPSWFYYLSMKTCYLAGKKVNADVKARFIQLVNTWI